MSPRSFTTKTRSLSGQYQRPGELIALNKTGKIFGRYPLDGSGNIEGLPTLIQN
ncbi:MULTISPECIES: SdiA-regulated domain-containing protein [Pseudomonas putida group]|uniref:SdiA-regulated domain-containing protein n=1 Tax=Pseudomonas putida group TaxID=136845 RepID=UPI00352AAED4